MRNKVFNTSVGIRGEKLKIWIYVGETMEVLIITFK